MRFRQLDKIVDLQPSVEITAERTVTGRDRYFNDHFPQFPVMPGVLTMEAMFQACDWLLRKTDDFSRSLVLLKEIRGLKFSGFVRPGQSVVVTGQIKKLEEQQATCAARVTVDNDVVASARLVVERLNLADRYPVRAASDPFLRHRKKEQYGVLDPLSPHNQPVAATCFRWLWIDRFMEFVRGRRAVAIKTVSMSDEPLDLYMPGFPMMPCSLIIEGLAQTGGILINESRNLEEQVVLAKVSKAVFHRAALPGDTMTYSAEIVDIAPGGAIVRGTSHIDKELHAEVDLCFAFLEDQLGGMEIIDPASLLRIVRLYGLYDVGKTENGDPLTVPQRLLDAERQQREP